MLSRLLAKITGADKKKKYPDQQAEIMGRIGDYVIIFPYGLYCDLPVDALAEEVKHGMLIPITVIRPDDIEQGEPVFYHPETNTRIIPRNDGSLDILAGSNDVNVQCENANIIAAMDVDIQCANANVAASAGIDLTAPLTTITGDLTVTGNIISGINISAVGVLSGGSLVITGAGSIGGKDFATHIHTGSPTAPIGGISNTGVMV